jgi:hypothetical protein
MAMNGAVTIRNILKSCQAVKESEAAEQQPRQNLIYLLGNSSDNFTVAKEAPRSIKHFR